VDEKKTLRGGPLQTGDATIQESECPDLITEAEIVMTIVVARPIPRHHGEEDKDTETATAKDTVLRDTIVEAEATAVARDGVANRTTAARVEKSSWKDYLWTWWKKTLDYSILPPFASQSALCTGRSEQRLHHFPIHCS
jgi:hypothetical protein